MQMIFVTQSNTECPIIVINNVPHFLFILLFCHNYPMVEICTPTITVNHIDILKLPQVYIVHEFVNNYEKHEINESEK